MINHTRLTGGLVRKDPVDTVHPLVRLHPVTGEKCLFFNGEFITRIEGMKVPEQKWLLDFLMNHVATGHDFQARVRWQPKTIVIFDNRSTIRMFPSLISFQIAQANNVKDSAIVDYLDDDNSAQLRHIFRLCALGERPMPTHRPDEHDHDSHDSNSEFSE